MAAVIPEMRWPTAKSLEEFKALKQPEGMRAEWQNRRGHLYPAG
jgi:hypothetical protein